MRTAICDDEKEVRNILADMVKAICPDTDVVCYETGEELLAAECEPDIVLLDIQMPGRNGMDTAMELRKKNASMILIFVTAMEEYVFQAFDVGAFHYLVKPFTDEKFEAIYRSAVKQWKEFTGKSSGEDRKYLLIKNGGTHRKIYLDDIIYAEVFNRKIMIHSLDEDVECYGRLTELEKQAGEDFFRSHRAYLVSLRHVVKYNASMIWLDKGTALMAKKNYPQFVKCYLRYNLRKGKK